MIVFDASCIVSATFDREGTPSKALRQALGHDTVALSAPVLREVVDVLNRPKLSHFVDSELRDEILGLIRRRGARFSPIVRVAECRDAKDDKYLELALASGASTIVSSDADLLVLDSWRGVRILTPRAYRDLVRSA